MIRLALLTMLAFLSGSCSRPAEPHIITGEAMGTTYRIKYTGPVRHFAFGRLLATLDADLSTWREDSWVAQFNRSGSHEPMEMPHSVAELLALSSTLHPQTHGRFDPAIGSLIRLWGFGAWKQEGQPEPTPAQIDAARAASGFHLLEITGNQLRKKRDGVMLDFSAIAKGYAVDRMAALMRAAGCRDFIIEFGGDLLASGHAPGKSGWVVDGPSLKEPVTLVNQAIATSGSEHHFRGQLSHIIDPARGIPIPVAAPVSAIAHTCAEADALATARAVEQATILTAAP